VRTFELAASAEAAGFRACMRCRPYRAQPCLSSQAAPLLVCKAVRLIVDGALDEATEDDLGATLGLSGRHIRRLFLEQLGLTPDQLARSTRVHFARRLLDDSDLSITDITFAAGFGSIRQFNRECQATFHATPSQLRAQRRRGDRLVADGGLALRLPFQPPFDWQAMLAQLGTRAIDGVEHVSADCYRRTVIIDKDPGVIEVSPGGPDHLVLRAHLPHWKGLIHIVRRVRSALGLDADVEGANSDLAGDRMVGPLVRQRPGIRPPGAWDTFEACIEAIASERANHSDPRTILRLIAERHGRSVGGLQNLGLARAFPAPGDVACADLENVGLDRAAIAAVRRIAVAAVEHPGASDPTQRSRNDLVEVVGDLAPRAAESLRQYLGEPDAFPVPDPTVMWAVSQRAGYQVTQRDVARIAEAWRPWRAHAATYLWHAGARESIR
jgi:AraC family transcriptional regulator, regulatory protein of adaptative response / DNA-3-methyladenine glycosylase II